MSDKTQNSILKIRTLERLGKAWKVAPCQHHQVQQGQEQGSAPGSGQSQV